jgi:cellulose synthase/poly-beta-1,6-N-acetylglucosamine synthase-like glycosyltransferase
MLHEIPPQVHRLLLGLAGLNLLIVLVTAVMLELTARVIGELRSVPVPEGMAWPRVSLIAAARNEARNIEQAVRSWLALDYPDLQITVVDDRSDDGTGEILDRLAAEFPRINVVHVRELPPGWLGKNHALQSGADASDGEWLLFTDADVVFEPTALRRAVAYATERQVDHLTATPDVVVSSWWLQAFCMTFAMFFTLFVKPWKVRDPRSPAHVGIGAFNLVRAAVYREIGGHGPIALRPDDDIKLGKLVKRAHRRQDMLQGTAMIRVEWYTSVRELIRGLEKNAFAGVDYSVPMVLFSAAVLCLFYAGPFAAVWVTTGLVRWMYAAAVAIFLLLSWRGTRTMRLPATCVVAFPLTVLLFVYIQLRTMYLNLRDGGLQWRGTFYPLKELRANRV